MRWTRPIVLVVAGTVACSGRDRPGSSSGTAKASASPPAPSAISQPDPACAADGCLRKIEHVGDYDREKIAATLTPGVAIDNGYSVDTLTFYTSGREARATIAIPYGASPPAGGYHVVANNHGTVGVEDPCAVAGTVLGAGLAGTFGARGMIGVAVDYPGLGTAGVHPYLVSESEGHAVLDALRATRGFASIKRVPLSNRFAVVGLSQGGHATLAAAAAHRAYAPDLDIRAFAAAAPASGWEEHWRVGAQYDGPFVAVHAMLVYAWADHYAFKGPALWADDAAPRIGEAMKTTCVFSWHGESTLASKLGIQMAGVFSPGFLQAYRSGVWGDYAAFAGYFRANRIGPYEQTAPLKIYQGDADAIVPETATRDLVGALQKGEVRVDYEVVPGGTHTNVAFGFVAYQELRTDAARQWLMEKLDGER